MSVVTPEGWGTESGAEEYSPDKVYAAASDKRGHNERATVRCPPELLAGIAVAVGKRSLPEYDSVSDFIRDAMYHRLHYWQERLGQDFDPGLTTLMMHMELDQQQSELQARRETVKKADSLVQAAITESDLMALDNGITFARRFAEKLGQPWKQELDAIAERGEEAERRMRKLRRLQ